MSDIRDPRLIYLKGAMFVACGVLSAVLLIADNPSLKTAALIAVCIWSFARAYYFAFYVIEHYVDSHYRFAGLGSFAAYAIRRRLGWKGEPTVLDRTAD
jgi:hypothetical protein